MSIRRRGALVVGAGLLSGCTKLAVRSADEAAQAAKKGSDDVARSADDAAAAGKGDEAASKADEAAGDDGKTLSDRLNERARKEARREAQDELEESLQATPRPTSGYDPYETNFQNEVTVDAGRFVYWELPFRTWGESIGRSGEIVSVYYTVDVVDRWTTVDVFLFDEYWFEEYSSGRESKYVTAGSTQSSGGLSATVDTALSAKNYVLVVDNTAVGEASGETSANVRLRFSSSSAF